MKIELVNNKYHEKWYKVENTDDNYKLIEKVIEKCANAKSNLSIMEVALNPDEQRETPSPYYIIKISGGLNGPGEWTDYFDDLTKMAKEFEKIGHAWLIELVNDCADDVFYVTMGFKKNKK